MQCLPLLQACFIHCSQQCRTLAARMPEELMTPQPEADGPAAKAELLSSGRSPGKSGKRKAAATASTSGAAGNAAQGSKLSAAVPPVKKQRGGGSGNSVGQASSVKVEVKVEVKAEASPAKHASAAQVSHTADPITQPAP